MACRSVADKKTLTVAGIGKRDDLFQACTANSYCSITMKNNTGFYYVQNQSWGFQGRPIVRIDILKIQDFLQHILRILSQLIFNIISTMVERHKSHFF